MGLLTSNKKKILIIAGLSAVVTVVGFIMIITLGDNFLVELWWRQSMGLASYFWQRHLYGVLVFLLTTGTVFSIIFFNFRAATKIFESGGMSAGNLGRKRSRVRAMLEKYKTGSLYLHLPLALILSVIIALPLSRNWQQVLLFLTAPDTGISDPAYGKDTAYYLFKLPVYRLIKDRLLITFAVVLVVVCAGYLSERKMVLPRKERFSPKARTHMSILFILFTLIVMWHLILDRYTLLYEESHLPLFYGPGFAEMKTKLPFIWASVILLPLFAASIFFIRKNKKMRWVSAIVALLFAFSLIGRNVNFLTQSVQRYRVAPNEISAEKEYIEYNITATNDAYGLSSIEERRYVRQDNDGREVSETLESVISNVPLWNKDILRSVYRELQQFRSYYSFPRIHTGRYNIDGNLQQVYLAAREIDHRGIVAESESWPNSRLVYTHGYGLVMSAAGQYESSEIPWLVSDLPLKTPPGFSLEQPRIYYGLSEQSYVIAPNEAGELDYPEGSTNITYDYRGSGGIPVSSFWQKTIVSRYFDDENIFLTIKTGKDSRLLFRRNIEKRIQTLLPFLIRDRAPYPAAAGGKLYWITDAYTVSSDYPYSTPSDFRGRRINYLRNSVKVVVDAYNGTVRCYISDPSDPFAAAYRRIYPGLFLPMEELPDGLDRQLRYPKDFFGLQMKIYARYHQKDPSVFYRGEDVWDHAFTPYFITTNIIDPEEAAFTLFLPLISKNTGNLRILAGAGCEIEDYGTITLSTLEKGEVHFGPSQISAMIKQDPRVSEQLTLWDQKGTKISWGSMVLVPSAEGIFYLQPLFIEGTGSAGLVRMIRVIITDGDRVVMKNTLKEAFLELISQVR